MRPAAFQAAEDALSSPQWVDRTTAYAVQAAEYGAAVEIRVLGPVELVGESGESISIPGSKARGLVAILALEAGNTVTPQRIVDALWGEQEVKGPNLVHVTMSKLRRVLADAAETDLIATRPTGYELLINRDDVDALRFETLVDQARSVRDDPAKVAELLGRALQLWRGTPLTGVPDTDLTDAMRSRLEELRKVAVEDMVDAELALGRHRRLAPELEALVEAEPLRERRWGQLIRALYGSGRQAEALRAFQRVRDLLIEEIGVEPGLELRQLEAAVLAQDASVLGASHPEASAGPIGDGFRRSGNVRYPVGPCIGRADDLDLLMDHVERHRLVTLTGPGGVGKTRLAMELSVTIKDDVPDGVWWIELAAARSEADALAAVQRSLRMDAVGAADPRAALAAVATVLGDRAAVLVLDNCEHLLGSIAPAVEELLGRCGQIRVVATSREGLGIPAEALFAVGPLAPSAAVALFEARITGFVDGASGSADTISQICERLDRLPLALELAAARTRHLQLAEILERLTNRFELLSEGSRTAQAHQRNLHAVASWSYELLDEPERVVFERLSVFADGANLDAATSVCAAHGVEADDVERLLNRLIDKSLIVADRSGAETRFRMLETLAEYASERLAARGDRDAALRSHAMWVRGLARTVRFGSRVSGATVAVVQDEDVAIRDAIGWSLVAEPVLALEICDDLSPFWFGTMRVSVGWELLAAALDAAGLDDRERRSSALAWASVFATMVRDLETAERHADEALTFERSLGDPARLGRICFARALASGYRSAGDAGRWVEEARHNFTIAGSPIGLGHVSFAEGALRLVEGDVDAAAANLLDAITAFRQEEDHLGLILAVSRLGELAWRRGEIELFAEMHAEMIELGRASRSRGVITGATARLGLARLVQGDLDEAQLLARTALASSGESFMPVVNGYVFKTAGLVNLRSGHVPEGRTHLCAAIEAFEQGAGGVGLGQAAMCWVDLSRSHIDSGEAVDARRAAETAVEVARAAGDPWVREQTEAHLALVMSAIEEGSAPVADAHV